MLILSVLLPVLLGLLVLLKREYPGRTPLLMITGAALTVTALLGAAAAFGPEETLFLFSFGRNLDLYFHVDALSRLFALVVNGIWVLTGFYAFEYMKHEQEERRFFGFYILVHGILNGRCSPAIW